MNAIIEALKWVVDKVDQLSQIQPPTLDVVIAVAVGVFLITMLWQIP
jgi:hypothetical protein